MARIFFLPAHAERVANIWEVLPKHPECPQTFGKEYGTIRSIRKLLASIAEPSGVLANFWQALRNHPESFRTFFRKILLKEAYLILFSQEMLKKPDYGVFDCKIIGS